MSKRYYAATDGTHTVFRGTDRPDGFKFASWSKGFRSINFHNSPKPGCHPAIEITRNQYAILTQVKLERLKAANDWGSLGSPSDCWVANADVKPTGIPSLVRSVAAMLAPKAEAI